MIRQKENSGFIYENFGREVKPLSNGTFRNHWQHSYLFTL